MLLALEKIAYDFHHNPPVLMIYATVGMMKHAANAINAPIICNNEYSDFLYM
jgi:hypothetical protein